MINVQTQDITEQTQWNQAFIQKKFTMTMIQNLEIREQNLNFETWDPSLKFKKFETNSQPQEIIKSKFIKTTKCFLTFEIRRILQKHFGKIGF